MDFVTQMNEQMAYLYSNGKGEAGLEVGVDAGLNKNEYIRIPESLQKIWVAKIKPESYLSVTNKEISIQPYDETLGLESYVGKVGWVSEGNILCFKGKKFVTIKVNNINRNVEISELHIQPPTVQDVQNFYTVNLGHIKEADYDSRHHYWIHAVRLWSVLGGLVSANKNIEFMVVPDPNSLAEDSMAFAEFAFKYMPNSWTAAAARTTSWKKTNHTTGGTPAIGLPRRWMQREGIWTSYTDRNTQNRKDTEVTSAFYIATHAISVHAVLAQFVPEDDHHWATINPSFGFLWTWEIGESIKVRMNPRDQVAGTALVTDSMVVLKMLLSEGIAPALEFINQMRSLKEAYDTVQNNGMLTAVYKRWYFDGYPGELPLIGFNQRDTRHLDLASELAIVAVRYYPNSTISASPALRNLASQSPYESIKSNWSNAANVRKEFSSDHLVNMINTVQGTSAVPFMKLISSHDPGERIRGMIEYNTMMRNIGSILEVVNVKQIDVTGLQDYEGLNVTTFIPPATDTPGLI